MEKKCFLGLHGLKILFIYGRYEAGLRQKEVNITFLKSQEIMLMTFLPTTKKLLRKSLLKGKQEECPRPVFLWPARH